MHNPKYNTTPNMSNPIILCIPRIDTKIKYSYIKDVINELDLGEIDRLDIVKSINHRNTMCNRVFIHFKTWHTSDNAIAAKQRLENNQDIKVIYGEPHEIWKIFSYKKPNNPTNQK